MNTIDNITVDISVMLGSALMPVHQLLRMGRGAVIELSATEEDDCTLLANNVPVARGQVILRGDRIAITITEMLNRAPDFRGQSTIKRIVPAQAAEPEFAAEDHAEQSDEAESAAGEIDHSAEAPAAEDAQNAAPGEEAGDRPAEEGSFNLDEL